MNRNKKIVLMAVMLISVLIVAMRFVTAQTGFSAGGNLYDGDGELVGTGSSEDTAFSPIFQHPIQGYEIVEFEGFMDVSGYIVQGIVPADVAELDIVLNYAMYFDKAYGNEPIQSDIVNWHLVSSVLPEELDRIYFDKIQLIDYFDATDVEERTKADGTIWYSFTFPFVFVLAADWTTDYGDGGYRKSIVYYLTVEVVEVDPSYLVDLSFSSMSIAGGSLDTDYVPFDGLTNLPTDW